MRLFNQNKKIMQYTKQTLWNIKMEIQSKIEPLFVLRQLAKCCVSLGF